MPSADAPIVLRTRGPKTLLGNPGCIHPENRAAHMHRAADATILETHAGHSPRRRRGPCDHRSSLGRRRARCSPRAGALHRCVHPDVRSLADVRCPRHTDPRRVRPDRRPALLALRSRHSQRRALAAPGGHRRRPVRRESCLPRAASRHSALLLPHLAGRQLRHAAGAGLRGGFRRQCLHRRDRLELDVVPAPSPRLRARRLRRRQRRRVGDEVHRTGPHHRHRWRHLPGFRRRWLATGPRHLHRSAGRRGGAALDPDAAAGPQARRRAAAARTTAPAATDPGVEVQRLLRGRVRGVRRSRGMAAQVLRRQLRRVA